MPLRERQEVQEVLRESRVGSVGDVLGVGLGWLTVCVCVYACCGGSERGNSEIFHQVSADGWECLPAVRVTD